MYETMLKTYPITDSKILIPNSPLPGDSLLSTVGNTPLLPIRRIAEREGIDDRVQILAKAEWFNPGGSVKDRPARNIIQTALSSGDLSKDKTGQSSRRLLDSTSGNMGISYATFGAALGIPVTLAIPENVSQERINILHALGAELVLTDPLEGSDGAILKARELAAKHHERYFYANQYNNPANWQAHYQTTGPEIVQQTNTTITHFVAGLGTSGTLTGVGRYLREHLPNVRVVSMQPDHPFHGLEGLKHMESAILPGIYDPYLADEKIFVNTEAAYEMTRRLAREEGIFVGISSGAALLAALEIARQLDRGVVVTLFPDAGYKYLSDKLWEQNK
jgi:S-sulfo-L-cysteine synthase (O-acetyl-L-serine-dependent)